MNGTSVQFEGWHVWVQVVAFTIIFLSFCFFSVRTFFMKKEDEDKFAAMPLKDDVNS